MTVRDMAKREKKRAIRCFVDEYIQAIILLSFTPIMKRLVSGMNL